MKHISQSNWLGRKDTDTSILNRKGFDMNYKRIYRALHKAKKLKTFTMRMRAFRICNQLNWSSIPMVHRKIK